MKHPSRYDLEKIAAEEGPADVADHLETCHQCRAYVEGLMADRQALLQRRPASLFIRQIENRARNRTASKPHWARRRWAWATGFVMALICGIGLYLGWGRIPDGAVQFPGETGADLEKGDSGMRWMGDRFSLRVYALKEGQVVDLEGRSLRAGDMVRYEITPKRGDRGYAAVVAVENGRVSPVLPHGSDTAYLIENKTLLPDSVIIEKETVDLELLVFLRREPFDMSGLVSELQQMLLNGGDLSMAKGLYYRHRMER